MTHVQLFLDWDGTLTKHDTVLVLTRIGYRVNERKGRSLQAWDIIVNAYLDDLKAHTASYQPVKEQRKTIEEESKYLTSLKQIERSSVERVEKACIFKGIKAADLESGAAEALQGGDVELRPGWNDIFKLAATTSAQDNGVVDCTIVSVNWSGVFIRQCLLHAAHNERLDTRSIEQMSIWSNEIEGVHESRMEGSSGSLTSRLLIHTSFDKLNLVQDLIAQGQLEAQSHGQEYLSVYIGDTATDFDALLLADVGICVRDEPLRSGQKELADTFERVGVTVLPLTEVKRSQASKSKEQRTVMYWTNSLSDVATFVSSELVPI
jgi:2-hydroxy-3-keto-5-methylthiopentenyl-1-phosphate phosphatase